MATPSSTAATSSVELPAAAAAESCIVAASTTPGHGGGAPGGESGVALDATPEAASPVSSMPEPASWLEALLLPPVVLP